MLNPFRKTKSEPSRFNWQETPTGIRFTATPIGVSLVEYVANLPTNAHLALAQWSLLKELLDNGQAESSGTEVLVPHDEVCGLDPEERHILGLPELYPFDLEIRSDGTFNLSDFRYDYRFLKPDRKPLYPHRTGCVLRLTEAWSYVLTGEQFALLEALDDFNTRESRDKSYQTNLLEFAKIKGMANRTGSDLDRYLHQEDVVAPKTVRLRLRDSGESVEIIPDVSGVDSEKFEEVFDQFPGPDNTYNLPGDNGGRTRVVFKEKQREALRTIKRFRRVSHDQLEEIAKQPHAYFDPDVVELDPSGETPSFSARVRKIGTHRPRLYPFVSPYKSEWIPGIMVEDEPGTRSKLTVKSEEEFSELSQAVRRAKQTGEENVTWNEREVFVSDIERFLPFIEKQLKLRKKPTRSSDEKSETPTPVLIIEENIEETDYVEETSDSPIEEPFRHLLEPTPNVKSNTRLLPHQEEGLAWVQQLWTQRYPGGLLADDMGLGKTLQVLCFLEWHYEKHGLQQPSLVIAPIALLENWQAEYPKFFDRGALNFVTLYGEELQKYKREADDLGDRKIPEIEGVERFQEVRRRRGALDIERLQSTSLVLTTYETVRDFQLDLGLIQWAVVVIDEAQRIKTPGTLVTNAVKALKAGFRIALTGTPVENSLMDLWCITDFIAPGFLGSAIEFNREFCKPLEYPETDVRALGEEIRKRIGVHFKRRLKTDILDDLPEKSIHDKEDCQQEMPPQQKVRYQDALQLAQEDDSPDPQSRGQVLQTIHQLRDISDHPLLADSQWEQFSTPELVEQSAKLMVTIRILEKIQSAGEKAILFSDRRKTQHLLARVIRDNFGLADISIVNGETPGSTQKANSMKLSRQQAVDRFQSAPGFNAIIMSPLAAGVGLNITEANHVIHYSRWWNPAKEDQASDRVYRIGQKRPVHLYFPMAIHPEYMTFDLILHHLLDRKRNLSQGTLFPTERAEVTPAEILDHLHQTQTKGERGTPLTIEDIDRLEPTHFEAFVAALFDVQGHRVELTPQSGDKGVDVIVHPILKEDCGFLIQVKQRKTNGKSGSNAVQEIVAAKPLYEREYDVSFHAAVVTNQEFTKEAHQLSRVNKVNMHERKWLIQNLKQYPVTRMDIDRCWIRKKRSP